MLEPVEIECAQDRAAPFGHPPLLRVRRPGPRSTVSEEAAAVRDGARRAARSPAPSCRDRCRGSGTCARCRARRSRAPARDRCAGAVERDRAACDRIEPRDAIEQRGLAGAVRADQAADLAGVAPGSVTPSSARTPPKRTDTSSMRSNGFASRTRPPACRVAICARSVLWRHCFPPRGALSSVKAAAGIAAAHASLHPSCNTRPMARAYVVPLAHSSCGRGRNDARAA